MPSAAQRVEVRPRLVRDWTSAPEFDLMRPLLSFEDGHRLTEDPILMSITPSCVGVASSTYEASALRGARSAAVRRRYRGTITGQF